MAVTLTRLCSDAGREYSMKLVAGEAGMDNIVRWVHILEDSGSQPFLHGGELIVTTGISHGGEGAEWLAGFADELRRGGAVGLAVALGEYIPALPEEFVSCCEKNAFPLFAVEDGAKLLDLTYDLCRRITGIEKHENALADAFRAVINEPLSLRSHIKLLTRAGFPEESRFTAVCARLIAPDGSAPDMTEFSDTPAASRIRGAIRGMSGKSMLFANHGTLAAICRSSVPEEIKALCASLKDGIPGRLCIGISDPASGLSGISSAYAQAEAAMVASVLSERSVSLYKNIGIMKLILGVKDRSILRSLVSENLGVLTDYDAEHSTDLARVLRVYLENNSSVSEAAAIEKVHRNTINSKIRTVKELLGHELDDVSKSRLLTAFLISDVLSVYDMLK